MQTVVGLGQAGCNIADALSIYSEYEILKIDAADGQKDKKVKNAFYVKKQDHPEKYEAAKNPRLGAFFKDIKEETLFITSCGAISGMALRTLEHIKKKSEIIVMYIMPDPVNLTEIQKLQNNLVFNVLQEYTRSGVFKQMILVDNTRLAQTIGQVSILKYWESINNMIASTHHMINVFEHSRPVFTTFSNKINTAKITSFGLASWDLEKNEENMFFSLDFPREKRYYYAMPQKMLEEDETLMLKIQNQVKDAVEHDRMKVGYAVYPTTYDQPYVYCEGYSTLIQEKPAS